VYLRHTYALSGEGRLESIVGLLHRFYSAHWVQRVTSLRLQPVKESKTIKLSMTVEVLAIADAVAPTSIPTRPFDNVHAPLAVMQEVILNRNLFGPENQPPTLKSPGTQRAQTKRSLTFTAKATDQDPLDLITYRMEDAPPGAKMITSDGEAKISWTPSAPGDYSLVLIAADDGLPQETKRETVRISVSDPPPPRPVSRPDPPKTKKLEFDTAEHTVLVTIVQGGDGKQQIWLLERPTDKMIKCFEGDAFDIGSVSAVIESIGLKDIVFASDEGRFILTVGETLSEADKLPAEF